MPSTYGYKFENNNENITIIMNYDFIKILLVIILARISNKIKLSGTNVKNFPVRETE